MEVFDFLKERVRKEILYTKLRIDVQKIMTRRKITRKDIERFFEYRNVHSNVFFKKSETESLKFTIVSAISECLLKDKCKVFISGSTSRILREINVSGKVIGLSENMILFNNGSEMHIYEIPKAADALDELNEEFDIVYVYNYGDKFYKEHNKNIMKKIYKLGCARRIMKMYRGGF